MTYSSPDWNAPKHAFFSQKMKEFSGSSFYQTIDGREIEITLMSENKEPNLGWDDVQYLGIVTEYLRKGSEPLYGRFVKDF